MRLFAIGTGRLLAIALVAGAAAVTLLAANPDHLQQLKETGSCAKCNLVDGELGGLVAPEKADLSGAILSGASLYGSTLRHANLTGAILTGTNLRAADLTGAVNAVLVDADTDTRTICPDGTSGPCR